MNRIPHSSCAILHLWLCPYCGSDEVEESCWTYVNYNSEFHIDGTAIKFNTQQDLPIMDFFCKNCDALIGHGLEQEEVFVRFHPYVSWSKRWFLSWLIVDASRFIASLEEYNRMQQKI